MSPAPWLVLLAHVVVLSLLQVGGALAVAPDVHRVLVDQFHVLTDAQFNASIALAQSAPGPNVLYAAVAGFQAAGVPGALAMLGAILTPSSLLAIAVGRWNVARGEWRAMQAFKAGMAPITIALLCATSWILLEDAPGLPRILAAVATGVLVWRTRVHILWFIAVGAAAGALGWL